LLIQFHTIELIDDGVVGGAAAGPGLALSGTSVKRSVAIKCGVRVDTMMSGIDERQADIAFVAPSINGLNCKYRGWSVPATA